uniref:Uncharacterized protein n=1 Tax=Aegilops tauschii subsp. strangulata TaxID=200361 RepID=A0A453S0R8_AEGTS
MQFALDHSSLSDLESNFDTCVEDIPDDATEDGAWRLITSAVWNKLHKPKMWHQYIMRKMEIAKHIGLGPQVCICVFYTPSKFPVIVCWYKRFAYHFAELTCLGTQDTYRRRQLFLVKSCQLLTCKIMMYPLYCIY